jgi:hypothetical protein
MRSRDKIRPPFISDSQTGGFTGFFRRRAQQKALLTEKFCFAIEIRQSSACFSPSNDDQMPLAVFSSRSIGGNSR